MVSRRAVLALVVMGLWGSMKASVAQAQGSGVRVFVAPTRRSDAAALRELGARISRLVARRASGGVFAADDGTANDEAMVTLERAQRLAASGAFDDAATAFDVALEAEARAPHRVVDPAALVKAHVTRAAIALARGETSRAEQLLHRLLRYDPGFTLLPAEDSPRMRRALDEARRRLGPRPELRAADLGESCGGEARVLLVVRDLAADTAELLRFDDCKPMASTIARASSDDRQLAAALTLPSERPPQLAPALSPAPMSSPPPLRPPEPPPRAAPPTPPETPPESPPETPIFRKVWFWTVLGVVAAGSGAAIWATQRGTDEVHVVPRF